ncbi:hypothetical protein [Dokdonella sp.]
MTDANPAKQSPSRYNTRVLSDKTQAWKPRGRRLQRGDVAMMTFPY